MYCLGLCTFRAAIVLREREFILKHLFNTFFYEFIEIFQYVEWLFYSPDHQIVHFSQ